MPGCTECGNVINAGLQLPAHIHIHTALKHIEKTADSRGVLLILGNFSLTLHNRNWMNPLLKVANFEDSDIFNGE